MREGEVQNGDAVKVVLCDDSDFVRSHLATVLDSIDGIEIVGQANSVESSLSTVIQTGPDIVVLDIQFPDGSGLDALAAIKADKPDTEVIMLTNHANEMYRRACLDAGASYFFDKSREFGMVPAAIRELRPS